VNQEETVRAAKKIRYGSSPIYGISSICFSYNVWGNGNDETSSEEHFENFKKQERF
jgi:hypothetical protein